MSKVSKWIDKYRLAQNDFVKNRPLLKVKGNLVLSVTDVGQVKFETEVLASDFVPEMIAWLRENYE